MKKVKKAIIPAAGLGTRFLPATKAVPKEMLPIVDRPTIEYIVEEAIQSGIEDIIIVTGKNKKAIEDHFDRNIELENVLTKKEKVELLQKTTFSSKAEIHFIRQKEPLGLGHAVWCARKFIGDEPFAVLLGDDIVQATPPCLQQLIAQYDETQSSIVGVQHVTDQETERYGIIEPRIMEGRRYEVNCFVEKPKQGMAPSNLAIMGRYILTPDIFGILALQETGANGEIQLTDAIQKLNEIQKVYAYEFEGKRYDVGEQVGFLRTNITFALQNEAIGYEIKQLLQEVLKEEHVLRETNK